MPVYNLPPIRTDKALPQPSTYATWEPVANLDALAEALSVGSETARPSDLKSIPDAWAQTQVFQHALLDPAHPLHQEIEAQWRGLLALFALQPEFSTMYDLDVVPVDLGRPAESRQRLRAVLQHLLPNSSIAPSHVSWLSIGCVLFRERTGGSGVFARSKAAVPIGLLSPAVLITAGRDGHRVQSASVPWLVDGIGDPTKAAGLSPRHYQVLATYIEGLTQELVHTLGATGPIVDRLLPRLEAYYDACRSRFEAEAPLGPAEVRTTWPNAFFALLGQTRALAAERITEGHSDCTLQLRGEFKDVFKGVVLIDPALAESFGRAAETITVWERYSLRDAAAPATLDEIRQDAAKKGWLVVQPGDFFTHELVGFTPGTEIEAHGRKGFEAALMPFTPLVLALFNAEDLATAADMALVGEEHRVRLTVTLTSSKQHAIRKSFGAGLGETADVQLNEDRPDDLSIWPNFTAPNWRWNFLHFQYNPRYELQTRFALSAEFLAEDLLQDTVSTADRVRKLQEWGDPNGLTHDARLFGGPHTEFKDGQGKLLLQRLQYAKSDKLVAEFQRLPRGVEAIFFARRRGGEGPPRAVGLALVRLKKSAPSHADATVAVDFGTTNTVAYELQGGSNRPIAFEDRLLFPIRHTQKESDQRERLSSAYTQFFPLKRHDTPFPTVVRKRDFRLAGAMPDQLSTQLQRGHDAHGFSDTIFFVPNFGSTGSAAEFMGLVATGELVFGIKWAPGEAARRLTRRFLRQVMMMSAAELVDRGVDPRTISWRFSFPQAFTRQDRGDFESQVREAWAELLEVRLAEAPQVPVAFETEGAAAAHYFMYGRSHQEAPAGKLMLMFDIGGGTTDIALWYRQELRWRNSFRLAGGDFFTRYLANNIKVLEKIDFSDVATSLSDKGAASLNPDARLNFVELFVNAPSFGRNFEANFPTFSMEREGAGLRQCASIAVGGLFYYVGIVLKELIAKGVVDKDDMSSLTLAFAGRGSALLRYFDRGAVNDTPLHHLAGLLAIGADLNPQDLQIDTLFSQMPKHEVALGLLAAGSSSAVSNESRIAPLGESLNVAIGGGRVDLTAMEDVRRLLGAKDPRDVPLTELKAFLVGLKKQTGLDVELSGPAGDAARQIKQTVSAKLLSALRDVTPDDVTEDTLFVEPPFITELRALVNMMNLPIEQRDRNLTLKERLR
ncbi:hypothetical protein [Phenylobacterium sp.]|jgi:hypothetical protein|uniref:hypothetical protein n=1 Tax=Phenylobacterium sp. TaxID=1871053 RepID=UPI002F938D71